MSDIIPQKRCNKCLQEFPATPEYFVTRKAVKSGLSPICKECRRKVRRKTTPLPDGYKRCARCKNMFPANKEFFYSRKREGKDGLGSHCKPCHKEMMSNRPHQQPPSHFTCTICGETKPATSEYFWVNRVLKYGLETRCKECLKAKRQNWEKEYHIRYRERSRELERLRRLANPESLRTRKRRFRQTERGKLQHRAETSIRKARKKGIGGSYTSEDIKRQFKAQKGKCYWCHKKLDEYHVDHVIPVTREGSSNDPWNLVLACHVCNESRNNKLPHEWPQGGRLL